MTPYQHSREIDAPPLRVVPVVPIDTNHATTQHLLTDNLPISADGLFEFEGGTTDSELTAALLHGLSDEPYHKVGNISQHAAVEKLPDDVLMEIFIFDGLVSMSFSQGRPWEWHRLVHVCRRWRYIIFDSPRSLDLQLFCTYGTPVKDNLDCWPALPIVMRYLGFSNPSPLSVSAGDEDNIIAALQHPDRIRTIQLNVTAPLPERLVTLARQLFPTLETLELETQTEAGLILPSESFGGPFPRLRVLHLTRIAFPAPQRLLLSAENLVSLKLEALPNSEYISPEALVICLAVTTLLETLHLRFNFPISRFIAGGNISAPQRRVVLPSLDKIAFHGASEYLESLLSGIDAPVLKSIDIALFNQATTFHTPQLFQFVCHTEMQRWFKAKVYCSKDDISISLTQLGAPHRMRLRVRCMPLDWQLSCMAEICNNLSLIITDVRDLYIDASSPLQSGQDNMDPLPMSELFRPFSKVNRLFLSEEVAGHVKYALKATGVLPGAKVIEPALDILPPRPLFVRPRVLALKSSARPPSIIPQDLGRDTHTLRVKSQPRLKSPPPRLKSPPARLKSPPAHVKSSPPRLKSPPAHLKSPPPPPRPRGWFKTICDKIRDKIGL